VEEFFNHYQNDLERHAHTPSGVAGADLIGFVAGGDRCCSLSLSLSAPLSVVLRQVSEIHSCSGPVFMSLSMSIARRNPTKTCTSTHHT